MSTYQLLPQVKVSLQHILDHTKELDHPLVVAVSGIQKIGKTSLCYTLAHVLEQEYGLSTTVLSLDQHHQHPTTKKSILDILETLKHWIHIKTYSIILIEGTLLGFKPLPPTHDVWSQLVSRTTDDDHSRSLKRFNQSLIPLETHLYPLIDLFIQLSPIRLENWTLGTHLTTYQLYLHRLNRYGFFDQQFTTINDTTNNRSRHLVLLLDDDRKLVQHHQILDGLGQQQQESIWSRKGTNSIVGTRTSLKWLSGSHFSSHDRWLLTSIVRQQRKYILATLNPKVLFSFVMMSLLGVLGYSRRLSFIFEIVNKLYHVVSF
ncbi:uncharacterized protein BX664DRAFT_339005 [Halteromyces radiatus]|uniref:uncharacterized protein n=1 Tax=Halteromyces radiatus TaxID=101107 RepID=UPI002220A336|nr:uncharacterized protein BX664DRAFT_339005 [Halteromyces radiatus]KAI8082765.1 hypothetical protein BX664DRAFT_339005 [Halteromyces radiatus]